jgi:D-amino-acid oxidase
MSLVVLSTSLYAHRLLQAVPEAQIAIYASKFQSDVTTNGAAGVWMPYKLSETPEVLTDRYGGTNVPYVGWWGQ